MLRTPIAELMQVKLKRNKYGRNKVTDQMLLARRQNPSITQSELFYLAIGIREANSG